MCRELGLGEWRFAGIDSKPNALNFMYKGSVLNSHILSIFVMNYTKYDISDKVAPIHFYKAVDNL